jgi:integrase
MKVYYNKNNGAFFGKYHDGKGWKNKTVPVSIQREDAALLWLEEWLKQTKDNFEIPVPNVKVVVTKTFASFKDSWFTYLKDVKKVDEAVYHQHTSCTNNHIIGSSIANIDLETGFSPRVVEDWIRGLNGAPHTIRNIIGTAKTFYADCMRREWIDFRLANPFRTEMAGGIVKTSGRLCGDDPIQLSFFEAKTLLNATDLNNMRLTMYYVSLYAGLRYGEVVGLKLKDIDLVRAFLSVDRQLSSYQKLKPPKKDSYRTLPLHPMLVSRLKSWLEKGWSQWVGRIPKGEDPVFPNWKGEHFYQTNIATLFRNDLELADIPTTKDGHNLVYKATRSTFATCLERAGADRNMVGDLLGHKRAGVAGKYYIAEHNEDYQPLILRLYQDVRKENAA